jgi:hypothetical protein
MIATFLKMDVDDAGEVRIPSTVLKEIGATPHKQVQIMVSLLNIDKPVSPVTLTDQERERLKRIGELIEKTFQGMDLDYVREGRRDRWS